MKKHYHHGIHLHKISTLKCLPREKLLLNKCLKFNPLKPLPQKPSPPQSSHPHLSCHMGGYLRQHLRQENNISTTPAWFESFRLFWVNIGSEFPKKTIKLISFYVFAADWCYKDCKNKMRPDIWDPKTPGLETNDTTCKLKFASCNTFKPRKNLIYTSVKEKLCFDCNILVWCYWGFGPMAASGILEFQSCKGSLYSRLKSALFQQPISIRYPDIVHVALGKRHDKQYVSHNQQLISRKFCSPQDWPYQAKFVDATRSFMQHKDTVEGDGPATKTGCRTLSQLLPAGKSSCPRP